MCHGQNMVYGLWLMVIHPIINGILTTGVYIYVLLYPYEWIADHPQYGYNPSCGHETYVCMATAKHEPMISQNLRPRWLCLRPSKSPFGGLHPPWTNPGYCNLTSIAKWYLGQIRVSPQRHLATCKVTWLAMPQRECLQDGKTGFHGLFTVGDITGMKWRSI